MSGQGQTRNEPLAWKNRVLFTPNESKSEIDIANELFDTLPLTVVQSKCIV